MVSTVSPCPTVIGVPPSQFQLRAGAATGRTVAGACEVRGGGGSGCDDW